MTNKRIEEYAVISMKTHLSSEQIEEVSEGAVGMGNGHREGGVAERQLPISHSNNRRRFTLGLANIPVNILVMLLTIWQTN